MNIHAKTAQDPFDHYRRNLAGETVPIHDGEPQVGFYRKRSFEQEPGKARKRGPWEPASIFLTANGTMVAEINGREVDPVKAWTWLAKNPIPEAAYRFYVENGRWEDDPVADGESENPLVKIGGNNPPPAEMLPSEEPEAATADSAVVESEDPELDALLEQVEATKAAARQVYSKLTTEAPKTVCDKAQNIREQLKALSKKIDKLRVERKAPYLQAERDIDSYFRAPIAHPLEVEKLLAPKVTAWLQADRDKRQRAAEEEARRIAEEQQRLADAEAAARGEPAFEEAPPPPPVKVESAKVGGAVAGHRSGLKTKVTAKVVDQDRFYAAVKAYPDVVEFFAALANRLVKNATPPGVEKIETEVA